MKRIKMRQLVFVLCLMLGLNSSHAAQVQTRKGPQPKGCESNEITRIGFQDTVGFPEQGGRDYELWRCADGWHFSNLAGEQAYIKPRAQGMHSTCVFNSSTKEEFCCPETTEGSKTKTKVKLENKGAEALAKKSSEWVCGTSDPTGKDSSGNRNTLYIIPLDKNGNRGEVRYKISGHTNATNTDIPLNNRTTEIRVDAFYPNGTTKNLAEGSIRLEHALGADNPTSGDPQDCAPDKQAGEFCQLPPNLLKHEYVKNRKETKDVLKDTQNGKFNKVSTEEPKGDTFK